MPKIPSPLFVLAFDHRQVLRDLLGRAGETPEEQLHRFQDGKMLVLEALESAVAGGLPRESFGILVDEEYGADVARAASAAGLVLAMPLEASRTQVFEFQYGDAFPEHIDAFKPQLAKILVFHNPEDPPERKRIQIERMRQASEWAHQTGYSLMLEILIRPTEQQLAQLGGDTARFYGETYADLLLASIDEFHAAGIEPHLWKVESLPAVSDYEAVARKCRAGGREGVRCILLGNGADVTRVEGWLSEASQVEGFDGFAVGRSVWLSPLRDYYEGVVSREAAVAQVADTFTRLVTAFNVQVLKGA